VDNFSQGEYIKNKVVKCATCVLTKTDSGIDNCGANDPVNKSCKAASYHIGGKKYIRTFYTKTLDAIPVSSSEYMRSGLLKKNNLPTPACLAPFPFTQNNQGCSQVYLTPQQAIADGLLPQDWMNCSKEGCPNNASDIGPIIVGIPVNKDMQNDEYTYEFDPYDYQSEFFPGMADFIDENIVQGDKEESQRLYASYWDDWSNDVFDDWGFFYLYDVTSGKYYFPLLDPQNQDDGIMTTQTFNAFGRTFIIQHGYPAQGIFKFDISVNDNLPFRFGAYGNMGSDSRTIQQSLTQSYVKSNTIRTLYYHHNQDYGRLPEEQFYSYWIPNNVSQNSSQTYEVYYQDDDDMNIMSKSITNGIKVYFSKSNDVKAWVVNDL
jgi:hypothetical protein